MLQNGRAEIGADPRDDGSGLKDLTLYSKHGCARRRSLAGLHGYSLKLVHTSCGRIELSSHFRSWHHGPDSAQRGFSLRSAREGDQRIKCRAWRVVHGKCGVFWKCRLGSTRTASRGAIHLQFNPSAAARVAVAIVPASVLEVAVRESHMRLTSADDETSVTSATGPDLRGKVADRACHGFRIAQSLPSSLSTFRKIVVDRVISFKRDRDWTPARPALNCRTHLEAGTCQDGVGAKGYLVKEVATAPVRRVAVAFEMPVGGGAASVNKIGKRLPRVCGWEGGRRWEGRRWWRRPRG